VAGFLLKKIILIIISTYSVGFTNISENCNILPKPFAAKADIIYDKNRFNFNKNIFFFQMGFYGESSGIIRKNHVSACRRDTKRRDSDNGS
jgi:hypothetical protein